MNLVAALGRLLRDPASREKFFEAREAWLSEHGAEAEARSALLALREPELTMQAKVLVDKRAFEAAELLPRTRAQLKERFFSLFEAHASVYWPRGHLRHLDDALAYLEFLQGEEPELISGEDWEAVAARSAKRRGARAFWKIAHYRDLGWFSSVYGVVLGRRRRWRFAVPLPWPVALGRRRWRDEE